MLVKAKIPGPGALQLEEVGGKRLPRLSGRKHGLSCKDASGYFRLIPVVSGVELYQICTQLGKITIARARRWLTTNTDPWPLRDHFVMTAIYATVTLIGFGIVVAWR